MRNSILFLLSFIAFLSFNLNAQNVSQTEEPNKKLLFFSNEGCSKCKSAQSFFDKHHMPYENLAIKENRTEMYQYVNKKNQGKKTGVGYPVLVYGDSIYFSIKDLTGTLKEIQQMMINDGLIETEKDAGE